MLTTCGSVPNDLNDEQNDITLFYKSSILFGEPRIPRMYVKALLHFLAAHFHFDTKRHPNKRPSEALGETTEKSITSIAHHMILKNCELGMLENHIDAMWGTRCT